MEEEVEVGAGVEAHPEGEVASVIEDEAVVVEGQAEVASAPAAEVLEAETRILRALEVASVAADRKISARRTAFRESHLWFHANYTQRLGFLDRLPSYCSLPLEKPRLETSYGHPTHRRYNLKRLSTGL